MSEATARAADDSRHSVLSRARPLAQSALHAFVHEAGERAGALLPPSEYGRFDVREVDAKSALTRCRMPGEPWSLNPYVGCSHDCAYCYVPDVAHLERPKWGSYVVAKRNLPALLAREVRHKERRDVFLSSATDPYQPIEHEHRLTRASLEILQRVDWPVRVLTRNPLVRRDVDLLATFTDASVGMSVPTLDDDARRLIEPGAPPIEGRLRTLRALADAGLRPFANLAPTYPLTAGVKPDDVARAFRDAGVTTVYASYWRYLPTVMPVLRARLAGTEHEADFARAVEDPAYFDRLFVALRGAFRRAGVALTVMRAR